ncbi:unnamed protein product [Phytophthora fragariaefolia]|uniref:Unnamed protein product n=1 Tax=Phytophthora fragariaefolia TaxID=1490495 RepID=A0A9W6TJA7_9STRA|nr:unnamed protein product [Phytophthora fragariaefolia]
MCPARAHVPAPKHLPRRRPGHLSPRRNLASKPQPLRKPLRRPRFAYRDHSPGSPAGPKVVLYSGDECERHEAEGSHSAASPAPAAASSEGETRSSPHQADPHAKAARTTSDSYTASGQRSLPVRHLTPREGLARVRGVATKCQEAAAAQEEPAISRKGSTSQSPHRKARDSFRGLLDSSSDKEEEEGAVPEPHEISNDLDGQQDRFHAAQLQATNLPSAQASVPVQATQTAGVKAYPRGD